MRFRKSHGWMTALLCASALAGCAKISSDASGDAANKQQVAALPGSSWDSIKQLPDWSGVWVNYRGPDAGRTDDMALTPKYKEIVETAQRDKHQANLSTCLPAGPTAVLQHAILYEFLFTPGRVTMLFEDGEIRRIHTDGREHLPLADLSNSFMGDSIGHWEGNTLVVDTIGFPNGEIWTNYGVRATRNTHMVERLQINQAGRMQIDTVITDPEIFTAPYTRHREYQRTELPITEPTCLQNNRDTGTEMDLTPPPEE
ncbi:MAG: hypothetical protein QM808_14375 [Steroidobacteraceae bacterium]